MAEPGHVIALPARRAGKSFGTAEACWIWTMRMLLARRDGAGAEFGQGGIRPCEPDDVVQCFDRLYRQGKVNLKQAKVLRIYGERGRVPSRTSGNAEERADAQLWRDAMAKLGEMLRAKGIVAQRQRN